VDLNEASPVHRMSHVLVHSSIIQIPAKELGLGPYSALVCDKHIKRLEAYNFHSRVKISEHRFSVELVLQGSLAKTTRVSVYD